MARDASNIRRMRRLGWRVLVVWECQTVPRRRESLRRRIARFLGVEAPQAGDAKSLALEDLGLGVRRQ